MTRSFFSLSASLLAAVAAWGLTGCQRELAAPPPPPPPVVTVTRPVVHPVQTYFDYNGSLESVEMVQITPRVKGFLEEIAFKEGDEVKKGDLLFRIDQREYVAAVRKAEADLHKAQAELKHAQIEEQRGRELRASAALSDEDVEKRIAARETAAAMVMQAEAALDMAKLQLGYTEIRAPIDGQISRTLVTRGNLVGQNENMVLTTIVSMDPLYVYFDAPERDLIDYQRAVGAGEESSLLDQTLLVEIGVATEEGYPHQGTIDFRENRVDPGTGTVRMRGRIPNPKVPPGNARLLYPGLYARVRVPDGAPRSLPAIPEDALMTGQEGRFVYVLGEGNVVQKRSVRVGAAVWKTQGAEAGDSPAWTLVASGGGGANAATDGANPSPVVHSIVAIESGLGPDDRVIINGLTKARPGAPVAPQLWELKPPHVTIARR